MSSPPLPEPSQHAEPVQPAAAAVLAPLPYHRVVRDHFRTREPKLWQWFHGRQPDDVLRERVRLDLLKCAFRLERADRPELYRTADEVAAALGITGAPGAGADAAAAPAPITLYQAQSGESMNAGLHFAPGEVHVVLQGPVLQRLTPEELRALLGHEFTHFAFLSRDDGEFRTALAVLDALTGGADAEFAHLVTARHWDLYTEILCDRGALHACGDALVAIGALVKVVTGLESVHAESYVRQAEEIFAHGRVESEGGTHPETYVRARALMLFAADGQAADAGVAAIIEGEPKLDALDLPGQVRVTDATRGLLQALLAVPELQGEAHLAQARLYFDDFALATAPVDRAALRDALRAADPAIRDYYCYVVIDFVAVDRDVADDALRRGLLLLAGLDWDARLAELAGQELGLRKKELDRIRKQAKANAEADG